MVEGHKIKERIEIGRFLETIKSFKEEQIGTTKHTFFRLNEAQRKIFKEKIIKEIILNETPIFVGIQNNGNYAVFYDYNKDILRVTLDIQYDKAEIITFYILDKKELPRIK